ncbi:MULTISPECIES: GNAT family N-acetyltransferase [unclassified Exiguobacterium]|uniref:GNAT family N-acetyltransferase n=1 Tax=unclassified Exiguobacterium TaxID=2644629 RepID=UPI0008BECC12|nr:MULTISPECIES: GNAT family N-acetyltransferase [unclassified Exiguobacterium]OGX80738.1 GCN5 family acetyltransferase [Exiguobacterium sp. SH31]TCI24983.1 GNAT family N-acetyltransferase [Exiguobacterium sp. SH5S4]TCI35608.1 GNAT family N-acetyltransferase [Exiguobacterium sp. SH4S7]TCI43596.1 GNAT family N-acetyltransferase [Exiguobacterium sp. SH5S32]TCI52542.1 GNAT family N-acetyltransferase [Exiguobacterium sp. SH1S4]
MHKKTFNELTTKELYDLLALRTEVFVVEQDCPYQEVDGKDVTAHHYWIEEDGVMVAALRVLVEETPIAIGRVVTKASHRGKGYSRRLMEEAVIDFGSVELYLQAQTYVEPFYASFGFSRTSEEYLEDGIPHVDMTRERTKSS